MHRLASADDREMTIDDFVGTVLWAIKGKDGEVGFEAFGENGSAANLIGHPRRP